MFSKNDNKDVECSEHRVLRFFFPRFVYFSKTPVGCVSRQRVGHRLWTSAWFNGTWHPSPASLRGVENFCDLSPARTRSEPPALCVSCVIFVFESRLSPVIIAGRDVRTLPELSCNQSNVHEKKNKKILDQTIILDCHKICFKSKAALAADKLRHVFYVNFNSPRTSFLRRVSTHIVYLDHSHQSNSLNLAP